MPLAGARRADPRTRMSDPYDLVIIGAGPAGAAAAIEAVSLGMRCVVVDEAAQPGGQVYRAQATAPGFDTGPGASLRQALRDHGIDHRASARVWMIERGFRTHVIEGDGSTVIASAAVVLATGAIERVAPVRGWTLPGVIGLAGATILLKAEAMLPGARTVVAGRGPLLLLVASLIIEGGGEVAAIIDANPVRAWLARTPAVLSRPDLLAQGASWFAKVIARRVPVYFGSRIVACHGEDRVTAVSVGSGTGPVMRQRRIDCDAVCLGHGLAPATELSRQLGAAHRHDHDRGGWHVATDGAGRTDIPGLYACGDGAGVLGVGAAPLRGRLAARSVASDLGHRVSHAETNKLRQPLAKASRFGAAMTALGSPGLHQIADTRADTIVCRCEGVPRAAIDAAIADGASSLDAIKATTRCGMGPCGARYCGESVAALLSVATGRSLAEIGQMRGRAPARPLPLHAIMGGFDYADIPFPEPAPL